MAKIFPNTCFLRIGFFCLLGCVTTLPLRLNADEPAKVSAMDEAATLSTAKALLAHSQLAEAQVLLEKIVAKNANCTGALFQLGVIHIRLNRPEEAIQVLERAVALDANNSRYLRMLGDAYGLSAQKAGLFSKLGFARQCLAAYDRAVAADPGDVVARRSRYEFYRQAPSFAGGGNDKADAELVEIEKRDPVEGAILRVDLLRKDNQTDQAFAILADIQQRHPENPVVRFQLGRLAALTGQKLDEGEAALKAYLSSHPGEDDPPLWAAHWRLANIYERKDNPAAARTEYEETLKLNPLFERARAALKKLKSGGLL